MDNRTEPIRQDIDAIRESMTDKMEQIESKIKGTVDDTTNSFRRMVDMKYQVGAHPWMALTAAVLTGYALGGASESRQPPQPIAGQPYQYYPQPDHPAASYESNGRSQASFRQAQPGMVEQLTEQFGDELNLLKAAAIASLTSVVRATIRESMPGLQAEVERLQQSGQTSSTYQGPAGMSTLRDPDVSPSDRPRPPQSVPVTQSSDTTANYDFVPPSSVNEPA